MTVYVHYTAENAITMN